MNAITRFGQWQNGSPEQWLAAANRNLPPIVIAVLVVVLAYQGATITRALLPGEAGNAPAPVVAAPLAGGNRAAVPVADLSVLAGTHLFGRAEERPVEVAPVIIDAPETTLNLRLTGVAADQEDDRLGSAIIATGRNVEKLYFSGDTIEGTNATLERIYGDRVILIRGGVTESLSFPRELSNAPPPASAAATARQAPAASIAPQATVTLRETASANATRFSEVVRLSPHLEGGQMVGFRLNPGSNREAFAQTGLQPGDVVTEINGIVMDSPARAEQLYESLGEATVANITIMREGTPQVLAIDVTQLQNIADGTQ